MTLDATTYRDALADLLSPSALSPALRAVDETTRHMKREEYPNGDAKGGLNNAPWAKHALNRFLILGDEADYQRCLGWLDIYEMDHRDPAKNEPTHRDAGHRYEEPFYELYKVAKARGDEDTMRRCEALIIRDCSGHSIYDLKRYRKTNFGGIRYVTRCLANVAVAARFHLERGDESGHSEAIEALVEFGMWWLTRRFERPRDEEGNAIDEGPNAKVRPSGWFEDSDGFISCGDQIDEDGTTWADLGSPVLIPWQVYEIQPLAFESVIRYAGAYIDVEAFSTANAHLTRSFWRHSYVDHEDPLLRGCGHRKGGEFAMCHNAHGDKPLRLARPDELGVPTGGMLYPYWHHIWAIEDKAERQHHALRMLEATVLQCEKHWSSFLGMVLFGDAVVAIVKEHVGLGAPPNPEAIPATRSVREELELSVKLLRRAECDRVANYLQSSAKASIDLFKSRREV